MIAQRPFLPPSPLDDDSPHIACHSLGPTLFFNSLRTLRTAAYSPGRSTIVLSSALKGVTDSLRLLTYPDELELGEALCSCSDEERCARFEELRGAGVDRGDLAVDILDKNA